MKTYPLTVSSPDGNLFSGEVVQMIVRGAAGDLAVMADHIPIVTAVKPCNCRILLADGTERIGHTDGGVLSVSKKSVTLLSGSFTWITDGSNRR